MCLLWFPHISSICMHQHFWNSSVGNQHFTWYSTCPKRETKHQQKPCINPLSQSARQHATQKCLSSKQVMNMDDRRQARVCCDMYIQICIMHIHVPWFFCFYWLYHNSTGSLLDPWCFYRWATESSWWDVPVALDSRWAMPGDLVRQMADLNGDIKLEKQC